MKDGIVLTLLTLYVALQLYCGYAPIYRDVEDVCNQFSHVVITAALLVGYLVKQRDVTFEFFSKWLLVVLLILNAAEFIDECLRNNAAIHVNDYIFPISTVILTIIIIWKIQRKKH